jgi:hypothetical protein
MNAKKKLYLITSGSFPTRTVHVVLPLSFVATQIAQTMEDESKLFGQKARVAMLIGYVAVLLCVSRIALGVWFPPFSQRGLWFYSGIAAVVLGSLLVTPFFSKPADTISYVVAALLGVLAAPPLSSEFVGGFLWIVTITFNVVILVVSLSAIALKDSTTPNKYKWSRSLFFFSATLGTPRIVFSSLFFYAIFTFHRSIPREYLAITAAWVFLIALKPFELATYILSRLSAIWGDSRLSVKHGVVTGQQFPNIILVQQTESDSLSRGDLIVVQGSDGNPSVALTLDQIGFAGGIWHRTFQFPISVTESVYHIDAATRIGLRHGLVFRVDRQLLGETLKTVELWRGRDRLVGIVAPSTDVTQLEFEVIRSDVDLQEGRLVETSINSRTVLYQIINGLTREEILQQKNTRSFVIARGRKIGFWNSDTKRLQTASWVPQPNAPVYLAASIDCKLDPKAVGFFPNTDYHLGVDPDLLVTHNAAVLGILGSGKTFLTLELVERVVWSGAKVICLDMTDQYSVELSPFYRADDLQAEIARLKEIGAQGKTSFSQNVEEGGSLIRFRAELKTILSTFMDPGQSENRVKTLNPAQFEVWRQDSKPYNNIASMASLTVVEITRVITEVCLEIAQAQGMTNTARYCLVFEEAHLLIPEWNSVAVEGDRVACNGTSKAILQGRKFGLGCIAVTQRTANITKSILNQCNTVFALRTYDATGIEFLKHYIGEDYAKILSVLEDRHCVVFGRASSCKDPALIRLNERADLLRLLRQNREK